AALAALAMLAGLAVLLVALLAASIGRSAAGGARGGLAIGLPLIAAGGLGLLYLWPPAQRAVARVLPLRPGSPVGYAAVVLALVFTWLQLGTQLSTDVLTAIAFRPPLSNAHVLAQDHATVIAHFVGV